MTLSLNALKNFSLFNNSITISLSFIREMPKHFFPASFIDAPI